MPQSTDDYRAATHRRDPFLTNAFVYYQFLNFTLFGPAYCHPTAWRARAIELPGDSAPDIRGYVDRFR